MILKRSCPALFALAALTGCVVIGGQVGGGSEETVGMDNPAAKFCVGQGNRYLIRSGTGGSVGICVFPDLTQMDAWDYFRSNAPK